MTNTTEKMTQKSALSYVLTTYEDTLPTEVREKLEAMLVQVQKKSASKGSGKPTARQKENEGIKAGILTNMEENVLYTIGDMLKTFDCFDETMTSQRVSSLVKQLVDAGAVERIEDKRKAYFRLPLVIED